MHKQCEPSTAVYLLELCGHENFFLAEDVCGLADLLNVCTGIAICHSSQELNFFFRDDVMVLAQEVLHKRL